LSEFYIFVYDKEYLQIVEIMRKAVRFVLVALFCLVSVAMNAQADRVIKILTIGNSFSEDAVEQHLHDLAKAEDIKVIIGNMYIGGCSLERHLNNARDNKAAYKYRKIGLDGKKVETKPFALETALADEQWDYVSFQQNSGRSGQYDTWIASLPDLMAYVKARVPKKTKMVIHQTWAYDKTSKHKDFKNYNHDQDLMFNSILNAVHKVAKELGVKIIVPSGTAVQNARTTPLGECITRDGYHLHKTYGRYVAACTWYEKIFRKNVVGNPYRPKDMTPEQQLTAQKSAHAAVRNPKKVQTIK
jgi:hypothetical protein